MSINSSKLEDSIRSIFHRVSRIHDDKEALREAWEAVPISTMIQDNLDILEGDYKLNLLSHLAKWFSEEFFQWFSAPNCEKCNKISVYIRSYVREDGLTVEIYECPDMGCKFSYSFVRHKDPSILLRTRTGRCGEYADCFLLILLALDYDARLIYDTTDHVWNEVWIENESRWIHVDPCEGCVDTPLLYELGWGKKLEYCIGFAYNEVVDVTPRYALNFESVKRRRSLSVDEGRISTFINSINLNYGFGYGSSKESIDKIAYRRAKEATDLLELMKTPRDSSKFMALQGRKTGSIEWRISRGEYSPIIKHSESIKVMKSTNDQDEKLIFYLYYDCDNNSYQSSDRNYAKKGWSSLVFQSENIDYKYEKDWRVSYLARYEGCPHDKDGIIQWSFDLSELSGNDWTTVDILVTGKRYPNTKIDLNLIAYDDQQIELNKTNLELDINNIINGNQLKKSECKTLLIEVKLGGGEPTDSVAWQKPQLFRQKREISSNDGRGSSLQVKFLK